MKLVADATYPANGYTPYLYSEKPGYRLDMPGANPLCIKVKPIWDRLFNALVPAEFRGMSIDDIYAELTA